MENVSAGRAYMIQKLSELDDYRLKLAFMYAENYLKYGVDITEKLCTAVENRALVYKAEAHGYAKALDDVRKSRELWDSESDKGE